MKAKYLSILTAIAAIAALASCTKEFFPDKPDAGQPGETLRTITLSFDAPTKSWLWEDMDGNWQPLFNEGDSILVSNGIKLDTCRVFPKKSGVVLLKQPMAILTKLEGPLTAVYPYTAALCEGNTITGIKVPSEQSGSFADANICMANQGDVEDESLVFSTDVAILRFYTKGFEVDSIRIKSGSNPIASDKGHQITLVPKQQEVDPMQMGQTAIGQQAVEIDPGYWYAAIDVKQGNVAGKDLTFESVTHTQDTTVVKQSTSEVKLSANTMYNVFIPYYIKVNVGTDSEPEIQKWAYCNVGAFLPEEPGLYFAWGDTTGYRWSTEKEQFEGGHSFSWENAPFNNDSTAFNSDYFATVKDEVCPNGVLALKYDAATVNWGEGWRMPTKAEFEKLITKEHVTDGSGWMQFGDYLYFPATGSGNDQDLFGSQTTHYWSSTLEDQAGNAWTLYTGKNCVDLGGRSSGYPIRPIYSPAPESQSFTMTITPYTSGGTL